MKINELNEAADTLLTKYGSRAAERFGLGAEKVAAKELSKADKLSQAASAPPPVTPSVPRNLNSDPITNAPVNIPKPRMSDLDKGLALGTIGGVPAVVGGFAAMDALNTNKDKENQKMATQNPQQKPATGTATSGPPVINLPRVGDTNLGGQEASSKPLAQTAPVATPAAKVNSTSVGKLTSAEIERRNAEIQSGKNIDSSGKPTTMAATTAAPAAAPAAAQQGYQSKNKAFADKVNTAAAASGLKDMNKIQPGQKITMPDGSQHTVKKGETLSGILAGKKAGGTTPAKPPAPVAPAPVAPAPVAPAPVANANTTVTPFGAIPPVPQPDVTPNVAPATHAVTTTAPVLGTPENPYPQGAEVKSGSGETWKTSDGSALRTRSDAEIGDTDRFGKVTPGSYDKNRAAGDKNWEDLKGLGSKISNFFKESTQELNAIRKLSGLPQLTEAPVAAPAPTPTTATNASSLRTMQNNAGSQAGTTGPALTAAGAGRGNAQAELAARRAAPTQAATTNPAVTSAGASGPPGSFQRGAGIAAATAALPKPAVRPQPQGPAVGRQAQTAGGANELAKTGIMGGRPAPANPGTPTAGVAFNQGNTSGSPMAGVNANAPATQAATTTAPAGSGSPLSSIKPGLAAPLGRDGKPMQELPFDDADDRDFEESIMRESTMELNQLRKFSGLPELTESEVTVHKGTYGNSYGKEDVRDQYGHRVGKVDKGADAKKDAPKRGRGRPTKGDKDEHGNDTKFDTSGIQGMLGSKAKGEVGKKSVKHSLKDWMEVVSDNMINESEVEEGLGGLGKTIYNAVKKSPDEISDVFTKGNKLPDRNMKPGETFDTAIERMRDQGKGQVKQGNFTGMNVDSKTGAYVPHTTDIKTTVDKSIKESIDSQYDSEMQERIKNSTPQELSQMAYELAGDPSRYSYEYKKLEAARSLLRGTTKHDESIEEGKKRMSRAAKGYEKYGKQGMEALAKAGRDGASEKKLDTIRNKYDKYDNEQLDEISQKLATKAYAKRSGEAFDRHDYATDNDSQKDADKASAKADKTYDRIGKRFGANAQKKADKAADKEIFGEEKDLPGNQDKLDVAPPKGKLTKADFKALGDKKKKVAEARVVEESEFTYEKIGKILAQENPTLSSDSNEFIEAVYDEMIQLGMTPRSAHSKLSYDKDFLGEVVTSFHRYLDKNTVGQSNPMGTAIAPSGDPEGVKEAGSFIRNLASSRRAFEGKNMKDMQIETWKSTLNELINENLTISTTIDDQGHDSVNVSATEDNAHEIIELLRNAGLGGMGGSKQEHGPDVNNYGLPMSGDGHQGSKAQLIAVGNPHAHSEMGDEGGNDMMSLIKKMTGIEDSGEQDSQDYEHEDGECEECGGSPCGCDDEEEKVDEQYLSEPIVAKPSPDDTHPPSTPAPPPATPGSDGQLSELRAEYPSGSTDFNTGEVKVKEAGVEEGNEGQDYHNFGPGPNKNQAGPDSINPDFDNYKTPNIDKQHQNNAYIDKEMGDGYSSKRWPGALHGAIDNDATGQNKYVDRTTPGVINKIKDKMGWDKPDPAYGPRPDEGERLLKNHPAPVKEAGVEEGNEFTEKLKDTPKGGTFSINGKEYTDTSSLEEGNQPCNECGGTMEEGHSCGSRPLEEYANDADNTATQDLEFMIRTLSGGGGMGEKRSQATAPIVKIVTAEGTLMKDSTDLLSDFRKLSGI